MVRPNIFKAVVTGLTLAFFFAVGFYVYGTERVTNSSVTLAVVITRDGQEVLPDQIRSVRYLFAGQTPQPTQDVKIAALREAHVLGGNDAKHWLWPVSATFNIYRSGAFPFTATKVSPQIHSILLRVEFVDGKVFSLSLPFASNHDTGGALFIDFSDAP